MVQKQDSIVDGKSIKIVLKENGIKGPDGKEKKIPTVTIRNIYLKPGKIKCFAMTSLFTLFQKHKTDTITIEAMGIKTLTEYQPPVTYKYYVQFNYSYGLDGLIFWGWLIILLLLLSITLIVRLFRLIQVKRLLTHPKKLLMNITKKVIEQEPADKKLKRKKSYFGLGNEEKK